MEWTLLTKVRSFSDRRRVYRIEQHPTTNTIRCSCLAYRYSAVRWCKHLDQAFPTNTAKAA